MKLKTSILVTALVMAAASQSVLASPKSFESHDEHHREQVEAKQHSQRGETHEKERSRDQRAHSKEAHLEKKYQHERHEPVKKASHNEKKSLEKKQLSLYLSDDRVGISISLDEEQREVPRHPRG